MDYRKRKLLLGSLDTFIVISAVLIAYLLRFDLNVPSQYVNTALYVMVVIAVFTVISLKYQKMYRRVWQYASIGELISIIKAATLAEVGFYAFHWTMNLFLPVLMVPRSIYPISWALIVLGIGGSRFAWRIFRDTYLQTRQRNKGKNVLIVGAGNAGALVVKELKQSTDSELYPVAFIDDDPLKQNLEVMGLPVAGSREQIPGIVQQYGIQDIVIAIPSAPRAEIAKIIDICKKTSATIKILPSVTDLISGKVSVKAIREVRVEDLLGREPVQVDLGGIASYVTGQVVLVTGAGGSIGSELCRQISLFSPNKLLLLGHGENSIYEIELELKKYFPQEMFLTIIADIQDRERMKEVFKVYRPTVIFHAAAHKHVPLMERNPEEAVKNNVFGTRNLAECAHEYGASHFVMISTDKAVNPTSVMGTTKRIAEMFVQSLGRKSSTKFVAVRFGNVLGSRGSVIPVFKKQIQEGGPVTVTHPDMVRYFMTIPEAVQLVIQAGALAKGGEVFILDMGNPVKISDLAKDLIRLSGLTPGEDIEIRYTGIRPGEKLFEEILTNEEGTASTKHNRIFVGKPMDFSWEELNFKLFKLEQLISTKDAVNRSDEIRESLWRIVPTYSGVPESYKKKTEKTTAKLLVKDVAIETVTVPKVQDILINTP